MIEWINSPQQSLDLIERIKASKSAFIGLDTEFVRRSSFFADPGLLQISWNDGKTHVALVDLVNLKQKAIRHLLHCLYTLSRDQQATLVMHAPAEDLQIFDYYGLERDFELIIDTQIAACFCTEQQQISLTELTRQLLPHHQVQPSMAQSNWLQRPLSWAELAYAAEDAALLYELAIKLKKQLSEEDYNRVLQDSKAVYKTWHLFVASQPYARFQSSMSKIPRPLQARLAHLISWRERAVRELNIPRKWHLTDDALIALAKLGDIDAPPKMQSILSLFYHSAAKMKDRFKLKSESKDLFLASLDIPDLHDEFYQAWQELAPYPEYLVPARLNKNSKVTLELLEKEANNYARKNNIPPHAFMRKAWLKQLMQAHKKQLKGLDEPIHAIFTTWRQGFMVKAKSIMLQHPY